MRSHGGGNVKSRRGSNARTVTSRRESNTCTRAAARRAKSARHAASSNVLWSQARDQHCFFCLD